MELHKNKKSEDQRKQLSEEPAILQNGRKYL
jgi:hypothetical protein